MRALWDEDNPFRPGTATAPPHMAGREEEQRVITDALELIISPRKDGTLAQSPMAPIKLIGPRGVGKTTLLVWAEREAEKKGIYVASCVRMKDATPGGGIAGLVYRLLEQCRTDNSFVASLGIPNIASLKVSGQEEATDIYRNVLKALLQKTPVALFMDEVMHYDPIPLATVLQENQKLINEGWPLVMIIAGTPSLGPHLRKVDAAFINRAKKLPINLLSDEAACEALREPFKQYGVPVADEAIKLIASLTDNYPYLIQLAGEEVWNTFKATEHSGVDLDLVEKAKGAILEMLEDHHISIYEHIRGDNLLPWARLVVDLVEDAAEPLAPEEVVAVLDERGNKKRTEDKMDCEQVLDSLHDLGLVWIADGRRVRAALPSFFPYLKSEYKLNKG